MNPASAAILAEGLAKRYGELLAVDAIDLSIAEGEVLALLGPNGAGKTTFISMLCTLVKPTSGSARVAGHDILREGLEVRRNIGIVFQEPSVDDLLTGRENLYLHSMLYGVPRREIRQRMARMLATVGLGDRADDLVRTYSGGMRRRLEIARGLIHAPRILFLDEPTLGLDPASRQAVWGYIRELKDRAGTTIILTTHYMEEADSLADRVAIIDRGRIRELGTADELKRKVGGDIVRLRGGAAPAAFAGLDFVKEAVREDGGLRLTVEDAPRHLKALIELCPDLEEVHVRRVTLDDVFMKFTGRPIEAGEGRDTIFERIAAARKS
ncbi:MAG TPA: ABC transporter ATP-binding protein [Elusimicrobia bacterium]|nr:ABC transporter ATP-binding protein [Elusimicrobiota bacterium]HBT60315.1 ABC transporter ATP-binding protein [Elusimicrobiota bacterium]